MSFDKIEKNKYEEAKREIQERIYEIKRNKWVATFISDVLKRFDGKKITKRIITAIKDLNLEYEGKKVYIWYDTSGSGCFFRYEIKWFEENQRSQRWVYLRTKEDEMKNQVLDYQETMEDQFKNLFDIDNTIKSLESQYEKVDEIFDNYNKAIDVLNEADDKMGFLSHYATVGYRR